MQILLELWAFLKYRRKYWLWPLFIILLGLGFLVVMAQGSVLAPFIYSLF
jgi:4-amino-4-deoxy-L-arabinose transferase-like glycosyltransferase